MEDGFALGPVDHRARAALKATGILAPNATIDAIMELTARGRRHLERQEQDATHNWGVYRHIADPFVYEHVEATIVFSSPAPPEGGPSRTFRNDTVS
jgi:hypothetical protein